MTANPSGHVLDNCYHSAQQPIPASMFGQNSPFLSTHRNISLNPMMHGLSQPFSHDAFSASPPSLYQELSEATTLKIAALQTKLNQKLGPEYISQRPGPGGGPKLTYAEGWRVINLANEVFGFNGWSSSVVNLTVDFIDHNEESKRYTVGVTAIMKVTLRDGTFHEDIGYGMLENSKSKGAAIDKCKKEAVTDGLKRALRNFGNLLGNCLYDKSYTQEVTKIKIPPAKFDRDQLHRPPEFTDTKPNVATLSVASSSSSASVNASRPQNSGSGTTPTSSSTSAHPAHLQNNNGANANTFATLTRPPHAIEQQPGKPLSSVPPRLRSEVGSSVSKPSHIPSRVAVTTTPLTKGKSPVYPTGLTTPIATPAQVRGPAPAAGQGVVTMNAQSIGQQLPELEDEMSFSFRSDDDAILAAIDFETSDLGRPIDFDEGIGGIKTDESFASSVNELPYRGLTSEQTSPMITKVVGRPIATNNNNTAAGVQPQTPQGQSRPVNNPGSGLMQHTTSRGSALQQSSDHPNPNRPQNRPASNAQPPASKRSGAPSAGGFHFPPGINPQAQQPRPPAGTPNVSSGMGFKRSADTMQAGSSDGIKRGGPGMGLQQASCLAKREVLGRLEGLEGSDPKRMRQ